MFHHYIGVNYCGEKAPVSRLPALQVCHATPSTPPSKVSVPSNAARYWCRKDFAAWCIRELMADGRRIVGIDHGFSFPVAYMQRNQLKSWPQFLEHFYQSWPTYRDHMYVDFARENDPPSGAEEELRLCEKWSPAARSVFHFEHTYAAAHAAHAGIVWLREMRQHPKLLERVHFWPFDGYDIPEDKSVVAEVFSSMFRRRYPVGLPSKEEHSAYTISMWLKQMDGRGVLRQYFNPPLTLPERRFADIEGWALGIY